MLTELERELVAALRPFAEAWSVAMRQMKAGSLAHFGAIAKHEVAGAHFRDAAMALAAAERKAAHD